VAEIDRGISDDEVLDLAGARRAILVTVDKDFGDLVFRQGRAHHGVILVRLHGLAAEEKARITASAIADHAEELPGAFAVVERDRIRIRRGRPS
jgi:predicted nuclease of predicted toxin-antitoxin system